MNLACRSIGLVGGRFRVCLTGHASAGARRRVGTHHSAIRRQSFEMEDPIRIRHGPVKNARPIFPE